MEGSIKELSNYRLERAKEMLTASEDNLTVKQYIGENHGTCEETGKAARKNPSV